MSENNTPQNPNLDALLGAAQQGATPDELAGMSAMVQQFTAAVTAPVVNAPAAPAGARRFAGRVTKRAAVMAGIGIFVAGTAAAAAGGVLPTAITAPFHSAPRAELVAAAATSTPETSSPTTVAAPGTTETDDTEASTTAVTGSSVPGDDADDADDEATENESDDEAGEHAGRLFGLCQAWTDGVAKDPTLKPFHHLVEAAAEKNQTVEAFCADVLANPPASTVPSDSLPHHDGHGEGHSEGHHDDHGNNHGPVITTTTSTTTTVAG